MTTRINQNPAATYVSSRAVGESKAGESGKSGAAPGAGAQADKVSLSGQAHRLSELTRIAAASPDIDSGRVEALRDAIARGEYKIDADELAGSMLTADRLLGR